MSPSMAEKLARLAARKQLIESSIRSRWRLADRDLIFPMQKPCEVRILIYADGLMTFTGGTFGGLQHVKTLLESNAYPHVDFDITTAHREGVDTTATITSAVKLTDLNLIDSFDEVWFFGHREANIIHGLTTAERTLLDEFMTKRAESNVLKQGGVLVTGDHSNLGEAIGRPITRAGEMRRWDVDGDGARRYSSLEEGPDANLTFDDQDQRDDRPQTIHYTRFPVDAPAGVKLQPHPVLCGPDGPIDVLPDHQHEGEAVVPTTLTTAWPTNASGHQEQPFVIAFGDIKDPQVHYRQFGLISAYNGHTGDVGRIVADSSWHHWVDLNLLGLEATPAGQAALKKIEAYFLNCGLWLAPPQKQLEIRNAAWWSILWTDHIAEIPPDAPLSTFGEKATKALRRFASSCAVSEWVLGPSLYNNALSNWKLTHPSERSSLLDLSLEQHLAGGILRALLREVGPHNQKISLPHEAPPDNQLDSVIKAGMTEGLASIKSRVKRETASLLNLTPTALGLEI
jgi:hypothetical protein